MATRGVVTFKMLQTGGRFPEIRQAILPGVDECSSSLHGVFLFVHLFSVYF